MVKIPTYESQVGIANANAGQAAGYQKASAFVSPGQEGMPQALNHLAGGMNRLAGVVFNEEIRQRQEQLELDLMKDMQGVHAATAAFQDEYTSTYKGAGARDAAQQAAAFNDAQLGPLREKYGHNKTALSYIERRGGELALNNLNAMRDYSTKQGEVYKDSVFAGEQALAKNALEDWRTPPDKWQAVATDMRAKTIGYAQSKGLDSTAADAQYNALVRDAREKREKSRLDYLINTNPAEADRYIKANSTVGGPADFAARRESGGDIRAIGYDRTGGTSYGTFQMSSKAGTAGNFLDYLSAKGGAHAEAAAQIRAAGELDGGKDGAAALAWKGAVESGAITREMEEQFIQETHVTPALAAMSPAMQKAVEADPRLQKAVFSTAVQHGAGGAQKLMARSWEKAGGDTDAFLKALYADRKTQFGSSTPEVQAAAAKRMDAELSELLDPAAGAPDTELARALAPHEIAAWGAKAGAAVEHQKKEVFERETSALYGELHSQLKGRPEEERKLLATNFIAQISDADTRKNIMSRYNADESIFEEQYKAGQLTLAKAFREKVEADGVTPSQALQGLELVQGMDDPTREKLRKRYNGERNTDTHEKKIAVAEIRAMIDDKKVTRDDLDAMFLTHSLPEKREKELYAYFDAGGQTGKYQNISISRVQTAYRDVTGKRNSKLDIDTYEAIAGYLQPGKEPTYQEIKQAIGRMTMKGDIPGGGWFGMDKGATYHEAKKKGEGAGWLPDVTGEEKLEITEMLTAKGIEVTDKNIALFKKHNIWGIPAESAEQEEGGGVGRYLRESLLITSFKE